MDKKSKIATLATAITAINVGNALFDTAKTKYEEKFLYTASIKAGSFVYNDLLEWLNATASPKTIKFMSSFNGVRRFYDGEGAAHVRIGEYRYKVTIDRPELAQAAEDTVGTGAKNDKIVFTTREAAGIDVLENFLIELTETLRKKQRKTNIWHTTTYVWEAKEFFGRDIDSVFLPEGVKEDLMSDLERFFANEAQYERIGAPWHRGYLFYGPPGNGKSSLASAIAKRYRLHLYALPLSVVKDDKELMQLISDIDRDSVLLLEDIDIFSKTMSREQSETGPTLAGLLNALDGVATPHGLLTIMTTNHPDNLDPALVRPGRVDKRVELRAPTDYQIESMFEYAYGSPLGVTPATFESMAELSNILKRHVDDAEAARLDIKNGT